VSTLAIKGGTPVRTRPFPAHNFIGEEEKREVLQVLESGVLSKFIGAWHEDFHGGPKVRALEQAWAQFFGARFAVSLNSNTSGLVAAIGAAGIGPGDEVIVSPYTMSASATAIIAYSGIPVFADIESDTFGLDPADVRRRVTARTKAILVVHLFGHPARMRELLEVARAHDLIVIEDAAQAPGAVYEGRAVGTIGDMTVFSLNYHKHIHTGEGGIVTTDRQDLAERLELIRNHGESVVGDRGVHDLTNTFGFNLRMTELSAAVGIAQLPKLPWLLDQRIRNADFLNRALGQLPGLRPPVVRPGCKHVYYVQPFLFDEAVIGIPRDRFVEAVARELPLAADREWPLISAGYSAPLYLLPMYRDKVACGRTGHPFTSPQYAGTVDYRAGMCPGVEDVERKLIGTEFMRPPCDLGDMEDVVRAFTKVYEARDELRR
jgi:perosamine synthetase